MKVGRIADKAICIKRTQGKKELGQQSVDVKAKAVARRQKERTWSEVKKFGL